MNIASTPFYFYTTTITTPAPTVTTSTPPTVTIPPTIQTRRMSNYTSTLSNSDRSFIEFTHCLYKTKSVVQELQQFSKTVEPTLMNNEQQQDTEFLQHYLEESFHKFNHMCKVLLIVLTKLESNQPVRRERIDSFRQEVIGEWNKVISIRKDLLLLIQQKKKNQKSMLLPSPTSNSSSSNMIESDEEDVDSDTSIEPTTTSSSSSSSSSSSDFS